MVKTQMAVGRERTGSCLNSPEFKKYSKKAFSLAEALIALLIGSLILGMSAPLITKQLKHNTFTDVQAQLLNRKVESAKGDITVNRNNILSIVGSKDIATYSQYVQSLENKIKDLETIIYDEKTKEILQGKVEQKNYDKDITSLQTQISSKASSSSVNTLNNSVKTLNTNLTNLQDDVTEIEKKIENKLVPTGAVMAFNLDSCPKGWSLLTKVVPNSGGVFIRNVGGGAGARAGIQDGGVPNIKGCFGYQNGGISMTGAFYMQDTNNLQGVTNSDKNNDYMCLDASKSSKLYQNNLTEVRPKNIAFLYCVKD